MEHPSAWKHADAAQDVNLPPKEYRNDRSPYSPNATEHLSPSPCPARRHAPRSHAAFANETACGRPGEIQHSAAAARADRVRAGGERNLRRASTDNRSIYKEHVPVTARIYPSMRGVDRPAERLYRARWLIQAPSLPLVQVGACHDPRVAITWPARFLSSPTT